MKNLFIDVIYLFIFIYLFIYLLIVYLPLFINLFIIYFDSIMLNTNVYCYSAKSNNISYQIYILHLLRHTRKVRFLYFIAFLPKLISKKHIS